LRPPPESASWKPAAGIPRDAGLSDEAWHLSAMLLGGVHEERVAEIDVACLAHGVGKRTGMNLVRQRDVLVVDALIAKGEKNVSDIAGNRLVFALGRRPRQRPR